MNLDIVTIPDPILNKKTKPIGKITPELVKLAKNMLATMKSRNGLGLAAPQVSSDARLFVVQNKISKKDSEEEIIPQTIIFNPEIKRKSKTLAKMTEGCLSIPGTTGVVERPAEITITGLNEKSESVTIEAKNLFARVMQHEIDHLNGVLFTERLKHYRVVFFGTSGFGAPALEALIKHVQFDVVGVVTETDKPAGRGHDLQSSIIKKIAEDNKIPVLQPASWRKDGQSDLIKLTQMRPDFNIVASYGQILPQNVLNTAKIASLNIHPSLLPKYRGATPIQSAILNGEKHTGISIIVMSAKMDAGPIVTMYRHNIEKDETYSELADRLAKASAIQLVLTLEEIIADKAEIFEQEHQKATYTTKFSPETAKIDWTKSAEQIANHIRSFSAKPGAWATVDNQTIKILKAHTENEKLVIDQVQLPGKKPISLADLKNGFPKIHIELNKLSS